MVPITLTARPHGPAKLDCPDPSDSPLRGHFGPFGRDFGAQVAPTWAPGPAQVAILFESGIEIHKSHFSVNSCEKHRPRTPGWRPNRPQGGSEPPGQALQSSKVLPNGTPGPPFFTLFHTFCTTWAPDLSRQLPVSNFKPQASLQAAKKHKIIYFFGFPRPPRRPSHNIGRVRLTRSIYIGMGYRCLAGST